MGLEDLDSTASAPAAPTFRRSTAESPIPRQALTGDPAKDSYLEKAVAEQPVVDNKVDIAQLKKSLSAVVAAIKATHTRLVNAREERAAADKVVADLRATAKQRAEEAKGADGKPLYTNDSKRLAAADASLTESPAFLAAQQTSKRLEAEIRQLDIDYEYNCYVFRSMEIISRYRQ